MKKKRSTAAFCSTDMSDLPACSTSPQLFSIKTRKMDREDSTKQLNCGSAAWQDWRRYASSSEGVMCGGKGAEKISMAMTAKR